MRQARSTETEIVYAIKHAQTGASVSDVGPQQQTSGGARGVAAPEAPG